MSHERALPLCYKPLTLCAREHNALGLAIGDNWPKSAALCQRHSSPISLPQSSLLVFPHEAAKKSKLRP